MAAKETKIMMGMPVTVEIRDTSGGKKDLQAVFDYFDYVDQKFSTYKPDSEISKINRGEISSADFSEDMQEIFKLSEQTRGETGGYFNITKPDGFYDPSGIVKGWAIRNAAQILADRGFENFFVDAGGDIQASTGKGQALWRVGIRNPFNRDEIVKALAVSNQGVATSGTYIRGEHIYNPHQPEQKLDEVLSITVIGPNIYDADRFATAAFAMGIKGIEFISGLDSFEAYQIDKNGQALFTPGFQKYLLYD